MHIVLVEPEIPGNTGNIARLCAAEHLTLHLVEPLGFQIDANKTAQNEFKNGLKAGGFLKTGERTLDDAIGFSRNASLDMVVKGGVLLRNPRLVCILIFVLIHIFSLHILSVVTLSGINLHTF